MFELWVLEAGVVVRVQPVRQAPVTVGRAPDNDLVLRHPRVSAHHAVVWADEGGLQVRDLGSRNGTFVGAERLRGPARIAAGDRILVGELELRIHAAAEAPLERRALQLVDLDGGTAVPVRSDRVRLGSGRGNDLVWPDGPALAATLLVADGAVQLGVGDEETDLAIGAPFEVGGRRLVVEPVPGGTATTEVLAVTPYPYTLAARLDGPAGPEAVVSDDGAGLVHHVRHEQRATLLYLLGRQVALEGGLPPDARGWMLDDDVATGLWGRDAWELGGNTLHVLVHRTRAELREAGFDPWFIEKRRRRIRARVGRAEVR